MTRRGLAPRPVDGGHRPSHTTEFRETILVYVEIYRSARKHGIDDSDIDHALEHALAVGELDDGKVPLSGTGSGREPVGSVVSVRRDDGTEIVSHAMAMRSGYERFLRGKGVEDD